MCEAEAAAKLSKHCSGELLKRCLCSSQEQQFAEPALLQAMTHSPVPVGFPTRQMCACK